MLTYITWNVSPELFGFTLFGREFSLSWYGLLFAAGFIVGHQVFLYIFKKEGKPTSDVEFLTLLIILATVIGARLGHVLFYDFAYFSRHPLEIILPPYHGLASHGATISILIGIFFYSWKKPDQSFFWIADRLVMVAAIAGFFIRTGNLMNSEIYGVETSLPWGFLFVRAHETLPRHPTQIYEALFCLVLLGITFGLWKEKRNQLPEGFIFGLFLILLFTFRFLIEFIKRNQVEFENDFVLNMGQLLSIPAVVGGVIVLLVVRQKARKKALTAL